MSRNNKWLHWGFVVAWMGLIFSFSAQKGSDSGSLSGSIVSTILSLWHSLFPSITLDQDTIHFLIRKGAHFTVYLILGLLVVNALSKSGVKSKKRYALALSICFLYAISDEIHQAFVPNRGPSFWDVLLDTSGSTFGLLGYGTAKNMKKK
ncbi:VanZ family protein [Jeotgalibaca sp. A127]|uniref:VanZ family protein n=1 Tax=Jeotgalibaca sp. A127 TaxID=3457324 RepID=UPI003FD25B82